MSTLLAPSPSAPAAPATDAASQLPDAFQRLADAAPLQMWTALPDGQLDFVSARLAEYLGRSRERLIGEGWQDVVHATDLPRVITAWKHSLTTGQPYRVEFRLQDGRTRQYRWHLSHAEPMRDADGRITHWVGMNTDIDDQKRAIEVREAAVQLAEAERDRLRQIIARAPAVMAIYRGLDFRITVVNSAWERFTGRRNAVGQRARDLFPEVESQGIFELLERVYETGEPFETREMRLDIDRNGDGRPDEAWWAFSIIRLDDPRGREHDLLVHAMEITPQRDAARAA